MKIVTGSLLAVALLVVQARAAAPSHQLTKDGRYQLAEMTDKDLVSKVLVRVDTWTGKTWRARVEPGGMRWNEIREPDTRPDEIALDTPQK